MWANVSVYPDFPEELPGSGGVCVCACVCVCPIPTMHIYVFACLLQVPDHLHQEEKRHLRSAASSWRRSGLE